MNLLGSLRRVTSAPAALAPAGWGRRLLALAVDWIACLLVTMAILGPARWAESSTSSWLTLAIFWVESGIGTAVAGASFGQLATRLRVLKTTGGSVSLLGALLRSLLICLVVPPLVFKPDGRGLHDLAVGSAVYKLPRR